MNIEFHLQIDPETLASIERMIESLRAIEPPHERRTLHVRCGVAPETIRRSIAQCAARDV